MLPVELRRQAERRAVAASASRSSRDVWTAGREALGAWAVYLHAPMVKRKEPFTAQEWRNFGFWLNYIDRGLSVAYELHDHGDQDLGELGVSQAVTGVRWYATDLALLDALLYRAAGLRDDERVCFDAELAKLREYVFSQYPKLRALRNALFAHPPFVDAVIGDDEVLFFATDGVHIAPAEGGGVETVVDVFLAHNEVPSMIAQFRHIIGQRAASAQSAEPTPSS